MHKFFYLLLATGLFVSSCSENKVSTDDSFENVRLPDGSAVFLNHNSTIAYDKEFKERKIDLRGEAYFQVVPSARPFIVMVNLGEVKVLGTRFNIKSEEDQFELDLESGRVELTTGSDKTKLVKGQRVIYNKETGIKLERTRYKFQLWLKELDKEFTSQGRDIIWESKKIGKDLKKEGKKIGKDLKKKAKD